MTTTEALATVTERLTIIRNLAGNPHFRELRKFLGDEAATLEAARLALIRLRAAEQIINPNTYENGTEHY